MQPRNTLALEEIDLSHPGFWAGPIDVREGAFETLRREDPIRFFDERSLDGIGLPAGSGYWALTRHADIQQASRAPTLFSSARGATSIPDMPPAMLEFFGGMINMDDPRHGQQRRIISRGFTPRSLAALEAGVRGRAAAIIDRIVERGECDFVKEIAAPLPLEIICEMMGIPESQTQMVFDHTNTILGLGDPEFVAVGEDPVAAVMRAGSDLTALMKELGQERRANPKDDVTSALLHAVGDEEVLTDEELASFFILLVVAGNETTRNAISHGMLALCENPEQRRLWWADFERLSATAIEEIVRWASPVIFMRRSLLADTVLSGVQLREGDKVVLWYNSGNRDEAAFDDPYAFDVTRTPNEHVGFGGPGPHYCLGANLARREIKAIFEQIFSRLPDLEIVGEPERLQSNFIHGMKRMRCEFRAGPPVG